jgi:hypothetical protein
VIFQNAGVISLLSKDMSNLQVIVCVFQEQLVAKDNLVDGASFLSFPLSERLCACM